MKTPNMRALVALALLLAATVPQSTHAACKSHFDDPTTSPGKPGVVTPAPGVQTPAPKATPSPASKQPSVAPVTKSPVQTAVPTPTPTGKNGSSGSIGNDSGYDGNVALPWSFQPVTSVQARVQGNIPIWDAEHKVYVSSFGSSFEAKYLGVLDTVNTAAVEGAFKYVQAECINKDAVVNCQRKNNIKYVVFYKTTIAQPRAAMAFYQNDKTGVAAIEHCPFIPMDGGQCTPTNGVFPSTCDQYTGVNGQPKLGFCVGGQLQDKELLAPYPNNYWFSYPNSCPREVWASKTAECRAAQPGGLCPFGVKPDGVTCSFSYEILGWVKLDDVVGITSMTNPSTGKAYADYAEFCKAGGVEFDATVANGEVSVNQTIPFWKNPTDPAANTARVQKLVDAYNKVVSTNATTSDGGVMKPLPSITTLSATNPPCYRNNVQCATAKFGCRRTLYSQICEVCTASAADCVVAPKGFAFPSL